MTLDEDLRSAFARETATQPAPPPDPDGLIRRGRARRRRLHLARAGAAVAAALIAGSAGYAIAGTDQAAAPDVAVRPPPDTTPIDPEVGGRPEMPPGTYRRLVGYTAAGRAIEVDFTVDGDNWSDGDFPLVGERFGSVFAGIGAYQPRAIAAANGCVGASTTSDLGLTPRRLASQLANLPRSTVLQAPLDTRAFGHSGQRLRLRIDVECGSEFYRVADSMVGERGITYTPPNRAEDVIIDFWVLDVAGTVVVVDQWSNVDASKALVEQVDRARASIAITVDE